MSWTRFAATVSAAVLAGWVTSASAADQDYGRSGPFLGAGAAYGIQNFSIGGYNPDNSWGYNLRGGYRFNEYFAIEADWYHLVQFKDSQGDTHEWLIGANGKLYPFHGIIQPFLSAGIGWSGVKDKRVKGNDTTGLGTRFGAGLDVYITRNWALNLEVAYLLPTGSRSDYQAIPISLGFLYRFY